MSVRVWENLEVWKLEFRSDGFLAIACNFEEELDICRLEYDKVEMEMDWHANLCLSY